MVHSRAEVLERLHDGGSGLRIADVEHGYAENGLATQLQRDEFLGRRDDHGTAGGQLIGRAVGPVAPLSQDIRGPVDREYGQPGEHDRAERVQLELELRHDAEVAAAAADTPEQVGVLPLAGLHHAAVGQDHLGGDEVVAGQAIL